MTYYRIALCANQPTAWRWISTPLTSLQAVLAFLHTYRCRSHPHVRIFYASSVGTLEELLAAEQQGAASFSLTPARLLNMEHNGQQREALEQPRTAEEPAQEHQPTPAPAEPVAPRGPAPLPPRPPASESIALDQRRLDLEWGAGGDHDTPYRFAFPCALPELRAWLRLRAAFRQADLAAQDIVRPGSGALASR